jgi:hypothetical protein
MLPVFYVLIFLSYDGNTAHPLGNFPTEKACERSAAQLIKEHGNDHVWGKHICLQRRLM